MRSSALHRFLHRSCVVTPTGTPQVLYHGTRAVWLDQFDLTKIGTGIVSSSTRPFPGIWLTDSAHAAAYFADPRPKPAADLTHLTLYGAMDTWYAAIPSVDGHPLFQVGPYPTPDDAQQAAHIETALYHASRADDSFVWSFYVRLQNPLRLTRELPRQRAFDQAHAEQRDGIIATDVIDGDIPSTVYVVFSPYQLKSATHNPGTYDPTTPCLHR